MSLEVYVDILSCPYGINMSIVCETFFVCTSLIIQLGPFIFAAKAEGGLS